MAQPTCNRHLVAAIDRAAVRLTANIVCMERIETHDPPLTMGLDVWHRAKKHDLSGLVGAEVVAILVGRAEPDRLEARRTETAAAEMVTGMRQTAKRALGAAAHGPANVAASDADQPMAGIRHP